MITARDFALDLIETRQDELTEYEYVRKFIFAVASGSVHVLQQFPREIQERLAPAMHDLQRHLVVSIYLHLADGARGERLLRALNQEFADDPLLDLSTRAHPALRVVQ